MPDDANVVRSLWAIYAQVTWGGAIKRCAATLSTSPISYPVGNFDFYHPALGYKVELPTPI